MQPLSRRGRSAALLAALVIGWNLPPAQALCIGDCDDDGRVTIDELIRGVTIALGIAELETCPEYTCSTPGCVVIDLLVGAVASALRGCPATPTPTPTATTPTVMATPESVVAGLERVIGLQCNWNSPGPFYRSAYVTEQGYVINCNSAAGHTSRGDLIRYASTYDAAAAFTESSREREPIEFHDLPASYWEIPTNTSLDGADRYLVWQFGCWVVTAHSFDDTHFQIAAQPVPFSEAIFAAAGDLLLAECGAD